MLKIGDEVIYNFTLDEFPEDPIRFADTITIKSLDVFRAMLNQKIYPSPVKGALARFEGRETSQHRVITKESKIIKQSTAIDVFCEGIPFENMQIVMKSRLFNGIGVYLDTFYAGQPWVMLHLDNRANGYRPKEALLWFCIKEKIDGEIKNKYFYMQSDTSKEAEDLLGREELYKTYKKEKNNHA